MQPVRVPVQKGGGIKERKKGEERSEGCLHSEPAPNGVLTLKYETGSNNHPAVFIFIRIE